MFAAIFAAELDIANKVPAHFAPFDHGSAAATSRRGTFALGSMWWNRPDWPHWATYALDYRPTRTNMTAQSEALLSSIRFLTHAIHSDYNTSVYARPLVTLSSHGNMLLKLLSCALSLAYAGALAAAGAILVPSPIASSPPAATATPTEVPGWAQCGGLGWTGTPGCPSVIPPDWQVTHHHFSTPGPGRFSCFLRDHDVKDPDGGYSTQERRPVRPAFISVIVLKT
ncbi:hypothetical protein NM688_g4905 [Phlebia brevispora]|uniref:Uncharacterized protein n=1 Tax=Phlebia brevispora TaxID=194682 RepID=A0ACC1T1N1_9APHY|nr:hypothetical protein NM688_g4905 [Phlebia brevispora]